MLDSNKNSEEEFISHLHSYEMLFLMNFWWLSSHIRTKISSLPEKINQFKNLKCTKENDDTKKKSVKKYLESEDHFRQDVLTVSQVSCMAYRKHSTNGF